MVSARRPARRTDSLLGAQCFQSTDAIAATFWSRNLEGVDTFQTSIPHDTLNVAREEEADASKTVKKEYTVEFR